MTTALKHYNRIKKFGLEEMDSAFNESVNTNSSTWYHDNGKSVTYNFDYRDGSCLRALLDSNENDIPITWVVSTIGYPILEIPAERNQ